MQPDGIGDKKYMKDMFTPKACHARRLSKILGLNLMLLKGRISNHTPELIKEWFYMSHYKEHCMTFIATKKMLETSSREELIEYFRL